MRTSRFALSLLLSFLGALAFGANVVGKWTGHVEVHPRKGAKATSPARVKMLQTDSKDLVYKLDLLKGGKFREVFQSSQVPEVHFEGTWQLSGQKLTLTYLRTNGKPTQPYLDRYILEKGGKRLLPADQKTSITWTVFVKG